MSSNILQWLEIQLKLAKPEDLTKPEEPSPVDPGNPATLSWRVNEI